MPNILLISVLVPLLMVFLVLLLKKNSYNKRFFLSQDANIDSTMKKLVGLFGADLLALLPKNYANQQIKKSKLYELFSKSGNPFKITMQEFIILKIILGIVGVILGVLLSLLLNYLGYSLLGYVLLLMIPFMFYTFPTNTYKSIAQKRSNQFLKQLPDLIDYLIMLIQGNYGLAIAFEKSVDYLPEGIIKEEVVKVVSDLKLGKSMKQSLEGFANRAPVQNIQAFVQSLINANELSVTMIDILQAQSRTARKDLVLEIEKRIAKLPSKMTMTLSPTSAIAIGLVAIAPAIIAIGQMM